MIADLFTRNLKIKILAAFVSVFFWLVILGQKNVIVSKEIPVEYLVDPNYSLETDVTKVTVNISSKRSIIQSFSTESAAPIIDLRSFPEGKNRIPIKRTDFNLPLGVRIISVEPKIINLYLKLNRSSSTN